MRNRTDGNSAEGASEGAAGPRGGRFRPARLAARAAVLATAAYVTYAAMMWGAQERLIFPRAFDHHPDAGESPPSGVTRVPLNMADGAEGVAWFSLPETHIAVATDGAAESLSASATESSIETPTGARVGAIRHPAVLYFHGNDDLIDTRWVVAARHRDWGCAVLTPEYRGYGALAGDPSEAALVADGVRWFDWLAAREDIDPTRIGIHGLSLGGAVAIQVAGKLAERAAAGGGGSAVPQARWLVIEATLQSMDRIAHERYLPAFLLRHHFRNDLVLPRIGKPVLLLHGVHDTLIPVDHARQLHAVSATSEFVELDCDHVSWTNEWPRIERFIRAANR
ncbi:MAG: prolyl oligopeptidase family serine peptidase [Phycisphaerae bacterium]|nr:prolyl oligopeptidase family serine peptidase [Phycisphaerae bacterium]